MIKTTKTYPSGGGHMRVAFVDDDPNELKYFIHILMT